VRRTGLAVAGMLAATLATGPAKAGDSFEQAGDVLRWALPAAAAGCAWQQDRLASYAVGFGAAAVATEGLKRGLGDAGINERPNGESEGFPSGHAVTAFSGAGDLIMHCAPGNPWVAATAGGAAVLVAASRLDADEHDLVQVLAGAALGFFSTGIQLTEGPGGSGYGLRYELRF
jgi:membrane-associated phospholipid phosphatase